MLLLIKGDKMKKIIPIVTVLILCVMVVMIFNNKRNTFDLSDEIIQQPKEMTAEETIRLFFYYYNRGSDKVKELIDIDGEIEFLKASLLEDVRLIDVKYLRTENHPKDYNVYEVQYFNVMFNQSILHASKEVKYNTIDIGFRLVKEEKGSKWKIVWMGNG